MDSYAQQIKDSSIWDKDFRNWDDILDNGIIKCDMISMQSKALLSIIRTSQLVEDLWSKFYKKFKINYLQMCILEILYFNRKKYLTQNELSVKAFSSKSNTSTLLLRMQTKGYIKKEENIHNKRENKIFITSQGKVLVETIFEFFKVQQKNLFNEKDAEILVDVLKGFRKKIKSHNEK